MAPQKPKRPSMLTRQRQLRAQQQQVKNASRNQLPSDGGSSGNSRQARVQRANTTRAQAANNQRIISRGMEGFIRRGQANDKADAAARGTGPSGTTRTAGAGGVLGRPKPSAVTAPNRPASKPNSQPASRGGALVRSPGGAVTRPNGQATRPRGGQIEKAGPTIDVKANVPKMGAGASRSANTSSARPELPAGRAGGATAKRPSSLTSPPLPSPLSEAAKGASLVSRLIKGGGAVGTGIAGGQILGDSLVAIRRAMDANKPARPKAKPELTPAQSSKFVRLGLAQPKDVGNKNSGTASQANSAIKPPTRLPAPTQPGSASTPNLGSSSSGSSRRQAPAAAPAPMPKAVVNPPKQFNPGRGTSRTDNPLIKNDSWMMGKINQREQASADAAVASGKASPARYNVQASPAEYNVSQADGERRLNADKAFNKLSQKEKDRYNRRYTY